MTASPRLGFTELTAGQAVPETTVNEENRYLEQGASYFIAKDKDLATPPGSPADGDCYIVAGSPTGAWTGKATKLAFYLNTAWAFITPIEGTRAYLQDENITYEYSGAAWASSASYTAGGTDVALADGGTGASLADPNNDRIMFWDDSAGAVTWLAPGPSLSITGTTLDSAVIAKDEGVTLTTGVTSYNFVGGGVTATNVGTDVTVTIAGSASITAKDEGSTLTSSLSSLDFVGAGVVATNVGGAVTVTISGGGGGGTLNLGLALAVARGLFLN